MRSKYKTGRNHGHAMKSMTLHRDFVFNLDGDREGRANLLRA